LSLRKCLSHSRRTVATGQEGGQNSQNNIPTDWEAVRALMRATWKPLSALLTASTTLSLSGATVEIAFSTVLTRSLIGEEGGSTRAGVTGASAVKELTGGVGMEALRRMEPLRPTAPGVSS